MNANLDMFLEYEVQEYTPGHLEALHRSWKSIDRSNKLFLFNHDYHKSLLRQKNNVQLLYIAGLGIVHYSDWARDIAKERGI
jgi:hypothetical protein